MRLACLCILELERAFMLLCLCVTNLAELQEEVQELGRHQKRQVWESEL